MTTLRKLPIIAPSRKITININIKSITTLYPITYPQKMCKTKPASLSTKRGLNNTRLERLSCTSTRGNRICDNTC